MSDFLYTRQDLNNLHSAFSDYIDSPEITAPQIFLVGQGILRFLENWMGGTVDYHGNENRRILLFTFQKICTATF